MNDRQRVELMIIPAALWMIMTSAAPLEGEASEQELTDYRTVMSGAKTAADEPTAGLLDAHANKLRRRALRAADIIDREAQGQVIAKSALAIYYLLSQLIEEERIELWAGSPFGDAMEALLACLNLYIVDKEKLDASALKMSRRLRERLGEAGYFGGKP